MSETWHKELCPKCDTKNWIYCSNTSDISHIDVEAIECRKCHHFFFLGEEDLYDCTAEEAYSELGKEKPD